MKKEPTKSVKLCSACNVEPVWLDGLCQYCYEEDVATEFVAKPKEIMLKHGQALKNNPELQKERAVKKNIKIKRRR